MANKNKVTRGLTKRGKNYEICLKVDGHTMRKVVGPNRLKAERVLAQLKEQRAEARLKNDWSGFKGFVQPADNTTFAQAAADYLAERQQSAHSTRSNYQSIFKKYLLPEFGSVPLSQITEMQVAQFQSGLGTKLSARRINSIVQPLRSILAVSRRRKIIDENPAEAVSRVREPQADIDPLTREELELVLKKIDDHFRPLFTSLAWTGARPCELLALRWQDVDDQRNELRINKARVRGVEGLPKSSSGERFIPILEPVAQALKEQRSQSLSNIDGYVFVSKKGKPINKHLDRIWARALKQTGLRHRPSYQLRHTFASLCLTKGANPGWIARVLGHSTLQTTYKHYFRFIKDALQENERLLNGMFSVEVAKKLPKPADEKSAICESLAG